MYEINYSKSFKKDFKKLSEVDRELTLEVLEKLSRDEKLDPKYKDHALKGKYSKYRDCHVKPDLVLIYEKREDLLVLKALRVGKHSEVF